MKLFNIIPICVAVLTLTACSEKDTAPLMFANKSDKASSIVFEADDSGLLETCMLVAEERLIAEYPGLRPSIAYKENGTAVLSFDRPSDWNNDTLDSICKPGLLTIRKGADCEEGENGSTVPIGEIVLDNADISNAAATLYDNGIEKSWGVTITCYDSGKTKLALAAEELTGTDTPLAIWLDDELISAPTVNSRITDGTTVISGNFTQTSAEELARMIASPCLPCGLTITEYNIGDDK